MSFLSRSNLKWVALSPYHLLILLLLSALFGGSEIAGAYAAPTDEQVYQQTVSDGQGTDDRFNSPLQAGQMTLDDVLSTHPAPKKLVPAPITQVQSAPLNPPHTTGTPTLSATSPNSSTNVMLMQGMKSALESTTDSAAPLTPPQLPNGSPSATIAPQIIKPTATDIIESAPSPSLAAAPAFPSIDQQPQGPTQTAIELLQSPVTTLSTAPDQQAVTPREATQEPEVIIPKSNINPEALAGSVYQPGQAPRNLAGSIAATQALPQAVPIVSQPDQPHNSVSLDTLSTAPSSTQAAQQPVLAPTSVRAPTTASAPIPPVVSAPTAAEIVTQQPTATTQIPASSPEETLSVSQVPTQSVANPAPQASATAAEIVTQQQPAQPTNNSAPPQSSSTQSNTKPAKTIKNSDAANCVPHVSSWTKTCADAGYPANYTGQIRGETRTVCPANSLQDVWVANSCSPPEPAQESSAPLTTPNTQEQSGQSSSPIISPTPALQANQPVQTVEKIQPTASPSAASLPPAAAAPTAPVSTPSSSGQPSDSADGICGPANAVATVVLPSKGLCNSGKPSHINGKGPWTWTCAGTKGGATASCSADRIEESRCGPATFVATRDEPSDGLCNMGEATTVTGNGPWHWTCRNDDNTSSVSCEAPLIVDGKCGSADDEDSRKRPMDNLCANNSTPSLVTSNNSSWTWVCAGSNGGNSENCSAPKIADDNADNAASAPAATTTPATAATPAVPPNASPTNKQRTPTAAVAAIEPPSSKLCGSASELMAIQAPDKNLCITGTASSVTGDGPWTWTCSDDNGHHIKCSTLSPLGSLSESSISDSPKSELQNDNASEAPAPMAHPSVPVTSSTPKPAASNIVVNNSAQPECGVSAGSTLSSVPTEDFCTTGTPSSIRGSGPWQWDCKNGQGASVTCSAYKQVDAMCGSTDGTSQKQSPTKNLCIMGTPTKVTGTGPWSWSCTNAKGDFSVKCSATKIKLHTEQPTAEKNAGEPQDSTASTQQDTESIIKSPKPFAPAPVPTSTPSAPPPSNLKAPTEAASLPTDALPVQPPTNQPAAASVPAVAAVANDTTTAPATTAASTFNLDPDVSSIPFGHSSENINSDAQPLVDKLAALLQANSNVRITLTAYADSAGLTAREARRLSLTRALAIRDYLSSKGIANSRIDVRALGAAPSGSQDRVDIKAN